MRWPWEIPTRTAREQEAADLAVSQVRSHLRVLVNELNRITDQIEDKAGRLANDR